MTRDRPGFCAAAARRSPAIGESCRTAANGRKKNPGGEGRAAGRSRCLSGLRPPDHAGAGDPGGAEVRDPRPRRARFGTGYRTEPGRNSTQERGRPGAARRMTRDRSGICAAAAGRSPAVEGGEDRRTCRQGLRRAGVDAPKKDPGEKGRAAARSRCRPDRAAAGRSGADARDPRPRRARFGTGDRTEPRRNSARKPGRLTAARRTTRDRPGLRAAAGSLAVAIGPYCRQGNRRAFERPTEAANESAPSRRRERGVSPAPGAPLAEPAAGYRDSFHRLGRRSARGTPLAESTSGSAAA